MVAISKNTNVDFFMANSSTVSERDRVLYKNRQNDLYALLERQVFHIQPFFCTFDCSLLCGENEDQLVNQQISVWRITSIGVLALLCSMLFSCEVEQTKIPNCAVYLKRNIYNDGLLAPIPFST